MDLFVGCGSELPHASPFNSNHTCFWPAMCEFVRYKSVTGILPANIARPSAIFWNDIAAMKTDRWHLHQIII